MRFEGSLRLNVPIIGWKIRRMGCSYDFGERIASSVLAHSSCWK
jgi:hypothetical protein